MRRTNQGGSVLGFIIGGVLLALLLVGGVYLVRLQSTSASQPSPQKPQETPAEQTPEQAKPESHESTGKEQSSPEASTPTQLPSGNGSESQHQMPQTGPHETLLSVVALALISGLLVSYVRSRRLLASL